MQDYRDDNPYMTTDFYFPSPSSTMNHLLNIPDTAQRLKEDKTIRHLRSLRTATRAFFESEDIQHFRALSSKKQKHRMQIFYQLVGFSPQNLSKRSHDFAKRENSSMTSFHPKYCLNILRHLFTVDEASLCEFLQISTPAHGWFHMPHMMTSFFEFPESMHEYRQDIFKKSIDLVRNSKDPNYIFPKFNYIFNNLITLFSIPFQNQNIYIQNLYTGLGIVQRKSLSKALLLYITHSKNEKFDDFMKGLSLLSRVSDKKNEKLLMRHKEDALSLLTLFMNIPAHLKEGFYDGMMLLSPMNIHRVADFYEKTSKGSENPEALTAHVVECLNNPVFPRMAHILYDRHLNALNVLLKNESEEDRQQLVSNIKSMSWKDFLSYLELNKQKYS